MSTSTREKIISFVGQGISQILAAEAAGVSESYVSQLLQEPGVAEEVAAVRAAKLSTDLADDAVLETIERKALKKVADTLHLVTKATDAAKVFSTLNQARRKTAPSEAAGGEGSLAVTILLPKAAQVMIRINSDNQVVEVGGKSTAPLPSRVLPLLERVRPQQEQVLLAPTVPVVPRRVAPHVTEHLAKEEVRDKQRAASILDNMQVMIGGKLLDI